MPRLFISYHHADKAIVEDVVTALRDVPGLDVWYFGEMGSATENWQSLVNKKVMTSDLFIFILSPDSAISRYCQREVAIACQENRPTLVVRVHPALIPPPLQPFEVLEATDGLLPHTLAALVLDVQQLLQPDTPPTRAAASRLRLRTSPRKLSFFSGNVQSDDTLHVLDRTEDGKWMRVAHLESKRTGWVMTQLLAYTAPISIADDDPSIGAVAGAVGGDNSASRRGIYDEPSPEPESKPVPKSEKAKEAADDRRKEIKEEEDTFFGDVPGKPETTSPDDISFGRVDDGVLVDAGLDATDDEGGSLEEAGLEPRADDDWQDYMLPDMGASRDAADVDWEDAAPREEEAGADAGIDDLLELEDTAPSDGDSDDAWEETVLPRNDDGEEIAPLPPPKPAQPAQPSASSRFANYEFYQVDRRGRKGDAVQAGQALEATKTYDLAVWIGIRAEGLPLYDANGERRPIRAPDTSQEVPIYVVFEVDERRFRLEDQSNLVQVLYLPPGRASRNTIYLRVTPIEETEKARIKVRFYYNFTEIESFRITARVVDEGENTDLRGAPIMALLHKDEDDLVKLVDWDNLDSVPRREMTIQVRAIKADTYDLLVLYENLEYRGALRLTKADLEDLTVKIRDELEYLAVNKQSPILNEKKIRTRERLLKLVDLGRDLWVKLFESRENNALWHIGQFLRTHPVKDGGTIQIEIDDEAAGFVLPWNLVYDGPYPPKEKAKTADLLHGFWGMRYAIEQFYGPVRREMLAHQVDDRLDISFMLYEFEGNDTVQLQRDLMRGLMASNPNRIAVSDPILKADEVRQLLMACDSEILYFYSHGYTRQRLADMAFLRADEPGELDAPEPDRSFIQLQEGRLYLDELMRVKGQVNLNRWPLVFLNMCEGGQITPSLSDGFVPFFLEQQASAVIATECSMTTAYAHPFAEVVFRGLVGGKSLGEAMLAARRQFVEDDDLKAVLGLAYALYGLSTLRYGVTQ